MGDITSFDRNLHIQFFLSALEMLPEEYEGQEINRLTLAYFAISALDILDALHQVAARDIIDWVYSLQVLPVKDGSNYGDNIKTVSNYGFRGSPSVGIRFNPDGAEGLAHDGGNLAMTYSALAILRILGDDYSKVCRQSILFSMRSLQQDDGSFAPVLDAETDLRFVFCAVAICTMLDDWSGIDIKMATEYIMRSKSYDGGFGLSPGLESHGGATYCAVAALKLLSPELLEMSNEVRNNLTRWCLQRQAEDGGFQGRTNKDPDTCYAFWIGGSLKILEADHLYDKIALGRFLLTCQSKLGGFGKFPNEWPDLLHAYYGVCGFSLLNEPSLKSLCCELGLTMHSSHMTGDSLY